MSATETDLMDTLLEGFDYGALVIHTNISLISPEAAAEFKTGYFGALRDHIIDTIGMLGMAVRRLDLDEREEWALASIRMLDLSSAMAAERDADGEEA